MEIEENKQIDESKLKIERICIDYDPPTDADGGCESIHNYAKCYMFDPSTGYCPYLASKN